MASILNGFPYEREGLTGWHFVNLILLRDTTRERSVYMKGYFVPPGEEIVSIVNESAEWN